MSPSRFVPSVVGTRELLPVALDHGPVPARDPEQLTLPPAVMGKLDQLIDARRAIARATPQLCPRDEMSDRDHRFANSPELAVPVLDCEPVFSRLELAEHER